LDPNVSVLLLLNKTKSNRPWCHRNAKSVESRFVADELIRPSTDWLMAGEFEFYWEKKTNILKNEKPNPSIFHADGLFRDVGLRTKTRRNYLRRNES
jgi:hypothetical protein